MLKKVGLIFRRVPYYAVYKYNRVYFTALILNLWLVDYIM